jgi:nucleoside-diphosphate-sugar epimerase
VVDNSEKAQANPILTSNLLEEILASGITPKRIVISGSAAEYGLVDKENLPVREDAPLNANGGYGLSKKQEVALALEFSQKHNLPVAIARIFNPIGAGMHPKFLVPKLVEQVKAVGAGSRDSIEVNRFDAERDYLNIKDVAAAIAMLVENDPKEQVYNIGSGQATSTGELVELILEEAKPPSRPRLVEASDTPEPLVAVQADISKLHDEFGWSPKYSLQQTIKEIVDASR